MIKADLPGPEADSPESPHPRPDTGRPARNTVGRQVSDMGTIRNIGGVALFLFGTTYLWLTPALAMVGINTAPFGTWGLDTSGIWWDVTRVLSAMTLVGFTAATWGLFGRHPWWKVAALASAGLGSLALIPFWIAVHVASGSTPWFNVLVHALGCASVFLLLVVPVLRDWVDGHVMSGR